MMNSKFKFSVRFLIFIFLIFSLAIWLPADIHAEQEIKPVNTTRINHKPGSLGDMNIENFAVDNNGDIYILDLLSNTLIDKYDKSGTKKDFLEPPSGSGSIDFALSPKNLFLAFPSEVIHLPRDGGSKGRWNPPKINKEKIQISSIHADREGNIYIGSINNKKTIFKTSSSGNLLSKIPIPEINNFNTGRVYGSHGLIKFDSSNSIYLSYKGADKIVRVDQDGDIKKVFDMKDYSNINKLSDFAVTPSGELLILADEKNVNNTLVYIKNNTSKRLNMPLENRDSLNGFSDVIGPRFGPNTESFYILSTPPASSANPRVIKDKFDFSALVNRPSTKGSDEEKSESTVSDVKESKDPARSKTKTKRNHKTENFWSNVNQNSKTEKSSKNQTLFSNLIRELKSLIGLLK